MNALTFTSKQAKKSRHICWGPNALRIWNRKYFIKYYHYTGHKIFKIHKVKSSKNSDVTF